MNPSNSTVKIAFVPIVGNPSSSDYLSGIEVSFRLRGDKMVSTSNLLNVNALIDVESAIKRS